MVGKGVPKKSFTVAIPLLRLWSKFFATELATKAGTGESESAHLRDHQAQAFEIFLHFINNGFIYSSKPTDTIRNIAGNVIDHEWARLGDAWSLAQRLESDSFKDAVTDAIHEKLNRKSIRPSILQSVAYQHKHGQNGLGRPLLDSMVRDWTSREIEAMQAGDTHKEFLKDVCAALVRKLEAKEERKDGVVTDACKYHDHGADTPCYRTLFAA